ncbi:hypothetical protein TTHT_0500 [Thermotomaculum hydrothermale]|uniref:Tetratricopeptide repeat protein n=1 Tax=Thermotomaculum hydrothermale TaxID=981385 RepID=A0A7R6PE61_9BACT|nr:hypothetical protein [Thermotomaculum hydrothermale]BBB32089.1 hypothetical protein TTHT_0500 [Thermotomaculum hydrothermale]
MKKITIIVFLLFSLNLLAEGYCVFPFENRGDAGLNYLKYGFEIYIESLLNSDICKRISAVEEMDIPLTQNLTLATKIKVAEKMSADFLITGFFQNDENTVNLTLKIFKLDGAKSEYVFKGSLDEIFNNSLKTFLMKFEGARWPYRDRIDVTIFEKYVKAVSLLCIDKNSYLAESYLNYLVQDEFYLRTLFYKLYNLGEFDIAKKYFEKIENKTPTDYLYGGLVAVNLDNYNLAIELFKKGNRLKPDDIFLNNIAGCYLLKGEYSVAEKVFPEANKSCNYLLNRAIIFIENKDYLTAKHLLKDFCFKYGLTERSMDILSVLLKKAKVEVSIFKMSNEEGDIASSFEFLDKDNCDFKDIRGVIEDYKLKAKEFLNSGNKKRAEEFFKKVILLNPFEKDVLTILCNDYNDIDACKLLNFSEEN